MSTFVLVRIKSVCIKINSNVRNKVGELMLFGKENLVGPPNLSTKLELKLFFFII